MNASNMNDEAIFFKNELSWAYILSKQYNFVIKNADEIIKKNDNHVYSYFFKAYAFLKLDNIVQAKLEIKKAKKIKDCFISPCTRLLIESLYTFLSENKGCTTKINKLNAALCSAIKYGHTHLQYFLLYIIIEFLDETHSWDKMNCYLLMLKCLCENDTISLDLIKELN